MILNFAFWLRREVMNYELRIMGVFGDEYLSFWWVSLFQSLDSNNIPRKEYIRSQDAYNASFAANTLKFVLYYALFQFQRYFKPAFKSYSPQGNKCGQSLEQLSLEPLAKKAHSVGISHLGFVWTNYILQPSLSRMPKRFKSFYPSNRHVEEGFL